MLCENHKKNNEVVISLIELLLAKGAMLSVDSKGKTELDIYTHNFNHLDALRKEIKWLISVGKAGIGAKHLKVKKKLATLSQSHNIQQ